ncbi:hypothetical protein F0919_09950 [Taibaiella lutea]|uniref:Lipoprotein n=1 Tax=Taibaiella lutea TaxID=2608001 RepID=A0A5M6CII1_9BACT|nr:hypothetical protein [Taibaiella lutea]KAA5534914.1 hypothetical protein F0919_09950 [Taibaiella lutea]
MKKIATFFSVVAVAAIAFTSCSKKGDYTCVCTLDGTEVARVTWNDIKKSDAETACNQQQTSGGSTIKCELQ